VIRTEVDAPIEIHIEIGNPELVAGSVLDVVIRATAHRDLRVTAADVALVAKYTYRYCLTGFSVVMSHRYETVASLTMLPWGHLDSAESVRFPISLLVPADSGGTVEGYLAQVGYRVEVRLTMDCAPDLVVSAPITVLTRARHSADAEPRQASVVERRLALLAFEDVSLPSVVPGARLTGALAIAAWRPWTARAAQVSLIRRELVRRGPWLGSDPSRNLAADETQDDRLLTRQTLAEDLTLNPRRIERLPFTLHVPPTPLAPSTHRDDFTITWILLGQLNRRWRPGPSVQLELHAVTAPPWT